MRMWLQAICAMWKQNLGITCNIQVEIPLHLFPTARSRVTSMWLATPWPVPYSDPIVPLAPVRQHRQRQ